MAGGLGMTASELLALEENLSPKAERRSSLEPSFDDEFAAERRKRERSLVGLIGMFVEDGEKLEDLLKTCEDIPMAELDRFARHKQALQLSYEEMASNGPVPGELREAEAGLNDLGGRVNRLLGQLMEPGDLAQLRSRNLFAEKRRAELMNGDEMNTAGEADVS